MKNTLSLKIWLFIIVANFLLLNNFAYSAGVGIDATRIIYPQGEKSVSVTLRNNDEKVNYLTQITIASEQYPDAFEITPPLFRIEKMSRQDVRIMLVNNQLPKDRESVFYFKARMIPARDKNSEGVIIGFDNIIKLFYRPTDLKQTAKEAQSSLIFKNIDNQVEAVNNSPYYISFYSVSVNNKPIVISTDKKNNMIAPFSSIRFESGSAKGEIVKWKVINDLGGYDAYSSTIN
ncbi:molecular chaperone [Providencia manganoxydans]|uniref:Molecular chaperone n=1 Tax=Providencia manganoxydans TaxID=2923283 RepID=A0ABX7AHL8_9GAMM|nr:MULTISPECIES: molecular chaperone [Providencia]MDX4945555.1 molecular chaperone [Providencia manganoxydans]QQO63192.1 molecular chaperone [Providencia manganoxydans]